MNKESGHRGNKVLPRFMTVFDKMIVIDLLRTVVAVLMVIVVIIVSRKFIRVLAQAIDGGLSNDTVLALLGLKTVVAMATFLPASVFMAILMVLGRMYRDQEMAAVASAGGGAGTIYRAVFFLVVPLAFAATGLSMVVSPWAEAQMQILVNKDRKGADVRGISAGRFSEYSGGELVFYTEDIDINGEMFNVFVQNREHGRLGVVSAKRGRMAQRPDGLYLILNDGERIQGQPGHRDFIIENFTEYAVRLEAKSSNVQLDRDAIATEQLWRSDDLVDSAEMQKRLSIPLGVVFLSILAVPLAKLSPRSGIYGSLFFAFGIYFVYGNLQRVSQSWVIKGTIPVWAGYFWVDLLLFLLSLYFLLRLYGWKWTLMKLNGKIEA